jgi:hypothetical protein
LTKDQGLTVSLSTLASVAGSLLAVWAMAAPLAERALAGEIDKKMEAKLTPINEALKISTESTIDSLVTSISALRYKRDNCSPRPMCWEQRDQLDLDTAERKLRTAESVLAALNQK